MPTVNSSGFNEKRLRDSMNFCIWIEIETRWLIPLSGDRGLASSLGG